MKYLYAAAVLVLFCAAMPLQARAGERRAKEQAQPAVQLSTQAGSKEEKKQALINNFNMMRNQELRVMLLQQMVNEEVNKLGSLQEQFCKLYNLDVQKLRQGLYRYDEAQEKFIEVAPQQMPQAPAPQQ